MLTFHINRPGKNLPASRKRNLNDAKEELKKLFHKDKPKKKKTKKCKRAGGPLGSIDPVRQLCRELRGTYRNTIHLSPERRL